MKVYTLDMSTEYVHVERILNALGLLKTKTKKSITIKQTPPVRHSRTWTRCYPAMSHEVVRHLTKLTPVHSVNYTVDEELSPEVTKLLQDRISKYGASHFADPTPFWFKIQEESVERQNQRIVSTVINALVSDNLNERAIWLDSEGRTQQTRELIEHLLLTSDHFVTDEPMSRQMIRHLHQYPATTASETIRADISNARMANVKYGEELACLQMHFDRFALHNNFEIQLPHTRWTSYDCRSYPELHHACPTTFSRNAFIRVGDFGGKPLLATVSGLIIVHLEEQTAATRNGAVRLESNIKVLGRVSSIAKDMIIGIAAGCLGSIEITTTELLDELISPNRSWSEYKATSLGHTVMVEDLGDYRVNDWTRRMGDGTWHKDQ